MLRVMLVDDEPAILRRLKSIVLWSDIGCRVVATASDGEDALAAVEAARPDLVIADIRMPVIDGLQLAERLAEYPNPPDVILLTGHGEFEYARSALRAGVSDYLLKPIDPERLAEAISSVRSRRAEATRGDMEVARRAWVRSLLVDGGCDRTAERDVGFEPGLYSYAGLAVRGIAKARDYLIPVADQRGLVLIEVSERGEETDLLLASRQMNQDDLVEIGPVLLDAMPVSRRPAVVIGIGALVQVMRRIPKTLELAGKAVDHAFFAGTGSVIFSWRLRRRITGESDQLRAMTEATITRMKAVISTLDNSGFVSALTDLREGLSSLCPPPRDAMDAVHEISREVRREFGGTGGIREHFGLSSGSTGVPTLERYLEALESQVQDLMTTRGAKWGVRSEPVSSWVQRYIESHYDEPVTLKSVAQIVNLNPAYLGQRFRDETGMSFHDALLRVRMHVAADALRTTSTPIHTIAKQVGYQAPVNFYKGFRRVHETSPAEYRKRFTGNEE